jgi:methanogenic corrinoid protein MtbC1
MSTLEDISTLLQKGRAKEIKEAVQKAIAEGLGAQTILEDGLMAGMNIIGGKFKRNEVDVPEVLIAARAMNAGLEPLKPFSSRPASRPPASSLSGRSRETCTTSARTL